MKPRHGVIALAAGALIVLGAGCGNVTDQGSGNGGGADTGKQPVTVSPPPTTPDRQPARTPPEGGVAVPKARIDADLPKRYPVMVWTVDDGRTVGVVAQEGGCGKASAELTEQSANRISITLVETVPAETKMCTMDLRYPKIAVPLDAPLGDRTVALSHEQRER